MEPTQTPIMTPPEPAALEPKAKTSYSALLGLIVITVAILGAAYYLFSTRLAETSLMQDAAVESLDTQSDSTEPGAIESDLAAESPDDFDKEMDEAFAEFEASFEGQ
jgi:uncharacterized protein HemX